MWVIDEEVLLNQTWNELFSLIGSSEGKVIGELKLFDLVYLTEINNKFVATECI